MKNSKIYIAVAVDEKMGIGKTGGMPWHFSNEMKYFKKLTTEVAHQGKKNAVVMGRKTWESLPEKFRPLPDRENIVLTRNSQNIKNVSVEKTLEEAIEKLKENEEIEKIFIIGGASIFDYALKNIQIDGIYLTKIHHEFDCDTFFPEIPEEFSQTKKLAETKEADINFEFLLFEKA